MFDDGGNELKASIRKLKNTKLVKFQNISSKFLNKWLKIVYKEIE